MKLDQLQTDQRNQSHLDPNKPHSGLEVLLDARSQEISRGIDAVIASISKIGRTALNLIK